MPADDRKVRKTLPVNESLESYHNEVNPKRRSGKAKELPYEILNFDFYDPKLHTVGYTTDRPLK